MSYIVVIRELGFGSVQFLDNQEKVNDHITKLCVIDNYHEANSLMCKVKPYFETKRTGRIEYRIDVIPTSVIIFKIKEAQLKKIIFFLDHDDLIM